MQLWQNLLLLGGGLLVVLLASLAPGRVRRWLMLVGLNLVCGLALLAAVNIFATQLFLPLNAVTVAVSGVLGAPGVGALAILALI